MPNTYQAAFDWVLALTAQDETSLPYAAAERFIRSGIREALAASPALRAVYPALPSVTFADPDDDDAFWESVGYLAASELVILPPGTDNEVITSLKLANLEFKYKVADPVALSEYFAGKGIEKLGLAPTQADALDANDALGTIGLTLLTPYRTYALANPDTLEGGLIVSDDPLVNPEADGDAIL